MIFSNKINKDIRVLAKSNYYQTLYHQAKELKLRLFENDINLSNLQMEFLSFLNFYANLYMDLALGDIEELIFENDIYEDAYSYWKFKERREQKDMVIDRPKKEIKGEQFGWVFKTPTKRR